ncbi:hypothetical protein SprV_0301207200 [Sparganum proliferum]
MLGTHAVCRLTMASDDRIHGRNNQTRNNTLFSPSSSPPPRLLNLAAYNVRSLLDNSMSNPPERRTALVARELAPYKLNIAALSETYFSKQDQLEEMGSSYTFFWSGCSRAERRDAGIAFATRNHIVGRLSCLTQGINDRLMSLRLPLQGGKFATTVRGHAKEHESLLRRLRQLRPHQYGEDAGHAPTATQHCPQCTAIRRGQNLPASGGQLHVR